MNNNIDAREVVSRATESVLRAFKLAAKPFNFITNSFASLIVRISDRIDIHWFIIAVVSTGSLLFVVYGITTFLVYTYVSPQLVTDNPGAPQKTANNSAWVLALFIIIVVISLLLVLLAGYQARMRLKNKERAQQLLKRRTPEAAAEAVSLLDSIDGDTRKNAIYLITIICQSGPGKIVRQSSEDAIRIVNRIVPLLHDDVRDVRLNATIAMTGFARDYPGAVIEHKDSVIAATNDDDSRILPPAAITVGNLGSVYPSYAEEFIDALVPLLSDDDPDVRIKACEALGLINHNRSSKFLQEMIADQNPDVHKTAVQTLSARQDQQVQQGEVSQQGQQGVSQQGQGVGPNVGEQHGGVSGEFISEPPDLDFTDVAGMEPLKNKLGEQVIDPFIGSDIYEKYDVDPNSGILFHGPPGTGKTYLSKCLAGELGTNYIGANISDIDSKHVGEGVENIGKMFEEARQNQPCLVFIDEIDALARDRSEKNQHSNSKKMVNQLLQEASDIDGSDDILLIAATNNPDDIDDAMLRTGRFDSKIEIPKPDAEARTEIFDHHMDAPMEKIDESEFKRATEGLVSSDMVAIAQRAGLRAARREHDTGRESVVMERDVMTAIDEITSEQGQLGEFIQRPPDMDFDDVVGAEDVKVAFYNMVIDPLTNPEFHEEYGLGIENGILLYGPPGTGKTYLSKCLAGELGINYIQSKAGDLVSKWIGEGATNVQKMFDEARNNQPCLIFIDEIDALATDRSAQQQKSERQMVNQFLEELSDLHDAGDDVIVIGATNRPEEIDSAMLRTGRLSEKIEIGLPDTDTRIALFKNHLEAPSNGLEPQKIGSMTEGFVASDMENVAERAARKAMARARNGSSRKAVTQSDVLEAISEVRASQDAGR